MPLAPYAPVVDMRSGAHLHKVTLVVLMNKLNEKRNSPCFINDQNVLKIEYEYQGEHAHESSFCVYLVYLPVICRVCV